MGNLGTATSFFNEKNRNIVSDLVELLVETNQEVPGFLNDMHSSDRYSGSNRRTNNNRGSNSRYGGPGFSSRDFRQSGNNSNRNSSNRGGGGSRGGGGYGKSKFYSIKSLSTFSLNPTFDSRTIQELFKILKTLLFVGFLNSKFKFLTDFQYNFFECVFLIFLFFL